VSFASSCSAAEKREVKPVQQGLQLRPCLRSRREKDWGQFTEQRNVVKDNWFVCGVCGAELPVKWNF
jgi:hypothetical protein